MFSGLQCWIDYIHIYEIPYLKIIGEQTDDFSLVVCVGNNSHCHQFTVEAFSLRQNTLNQPAEQSSLCRTGAKRNKTVYSIDITSLHIVTTAGRVINQSDQPLITKTLRNHHQWLPQGESMENIPLGLLKLVRINESLRQHHYLRNILNHWMRCSIWWIWGHLGKIVRVKTVHG